MASINDIFQKQFALIDELISENNYKDAYKVCLEILQMDPYNSKTKQYKKRIEDLVEETNKKVIDGEMEKMKSDLEAGHALEVISRAEYLLRITPNNKNLTKFLVKAQGKYRDSQKTGKKQKIADYEKHINDLIQKNFLDEAVNFTNSLVAENIRNEEIIAFCRAMREKIINAKLVSRQDLMKSDKYEEVLNFLYSLKRIEQSSKKVEKLIKEFSEKLYRKQIEEKRDFILKAEQDIKFLYQMAKYEECAKAAKELLHIDEKNSYAKSIIPRAEKNFDKKTRKELEDQMELTKIKNKEGGEGCIKI